MDPIHEPLHSLFWWVTLSYCNVLANFVSASQARRDCQLDGRPVHASPRHEMFLFCFDLPCPNWLFSQTLALNSTHSCRSIVCLSPIISLSVLEHFGFHYCPNALPFHRFICQMQHPSLTLPRDCPICPIPDFFCRHGINQCNSLHDTKMHGLGAYSRQCKDHIGLRL